MCHPQATQKLTLTCLPAAGPLEGLLGKLNRVRGTSFLCVDKGSYMSAFSSLGSKPEGPCSGQDMANLICLLYLKQNLAL